MARTEQEQPPKPKQRVRVGRILFSLVLLGVIGGGLYFMSWLNSRRYFLIIDNTEVKIAKGRMLPVGHAPFVPIDPAMRPAYEPIPLPGGMKVPRGTTTFGDRVELDQALFRLLHDATEYTLATDNDRTPSLTLRYLNQIKSLTGITVQQQLEIAKLERDAQYVRARALLETSGRNLEEARKLFLESSRGGGGRFHDAEERARVIEGALRALSAQPALLPPERTPIPPPPVRTSTVTSVPSRSF
jgi:hypothetical protein